MRPHHQASAQNFPVKNPQGICDCLLRLFEMVSVRGAEGPHASIAPGRSPFWDVPRPVGTLGQESELENKQDLGSKTEFEWRSLTVSTEQKTSYCKPF